MAGIAYKNVEALKRRGVDARLVVFKPQPFRPTEFDVNLDRPDGFVRAQLTQWRALARLLPKTDVFHFYFGLTLVPRGCSSRSCARPPQGGLPLRRLGHPRQDARAARVRAAGRRARRRVVRRDPLGARRRRDPARPSTSRATRRRPGAATSGRSSSTRRRARRARAPSSSRPRARLPVDLEVVHGVTHDEAVEHYKRADIVVDQLNAGWYGLFAIEAMALGKPVVTFLHDEAVARDRGGVRRRGPDRERDEGDARRRAPPAGRRRRTSGARRALASRAYVEAVHDDERIADRLLALYARL